MEENQSKYIQMLISHIELHKDDYRESGYLYFSTQNMTEDFVKKTATETIEALRLNSIIRMKEKLKEINIRELKTYVISFETKEPLKRYRKKSLKV